MAPRINQCSVPGEGKGKKSICRNSNNLYPCDGPEQGGRQILLIGHRSESQHPEATLCDCRVGDVAPPLSSTKPVG